MFISVSGGAQSHAGPGDDRCNPSGARCRVEPEAEWDSMLGKTQCGIGAQYVFIMYGIWYFGELTKLFAYGFYFMFQVLLVRKGRA